MICIPPASWGLGDQLGTVGERDGQGVERRDGASASSSQTLHLELHTAPVQWASAQGGHSVRRTPGCASGTRAAPPQLLEKKCGCFSVLLRAEGPVVGLWCQDGTNLPRVCSVPDTVLSA